MGGVVEVRKVSRNESIGLYIVVAAVVLAVPLTVYLLGDRLGGIDFNMVIGVAAYFAGTVYSTYRPWITKRLDYFKAVDKAIQRSKTPPSLDDFFEHGTSFNKVYAVYSGLSCLIGAALTVYAYGGGGIEITNWAANLFLNFSAGKTAYEGLKKLGGL